MEQIQPKQKSCLLIITVSRILTFYYVCYGSESSYAFRMFFLVAMREVDLAKGDCASDYLGIQTKNGHRRYRNNQNGRKKCLMSFSSSPARFHGRAMRRRFPLAIKDNIKT